jgi:hypothetical protein
MIAKNVKGGDEVIFTGRHTRKNEAFPSEIGVKLLKEN